jgi:hypothetical protein
MGLSGLVGSGAADALDDVILQALAKQKFEEQVRAQQAQESIQSQRIAQDASQHSDLLGIRNREFDQRETDRRDRSNRFGVEDMERQGALMREQEAKAAQTAAEDAYLADESKPAPVRETIRVQRIGAKNISPEHFLTDADRDAKESRAVKHAGAVADIQARTAAKYREPSDGGGQVVDTVDASGKSVKRWASRDELRNGVPTAPKPRVVSGAERQAKNYYDRAAEAHETVLKLEPAVSKMGLGGQAMMAIAPNFLQSETGQLYRQAQRAFTEARLRKESGAAIPVHEYENDSKTYFAQPGDGQALQEQKRKARETVLAGIRNEAKRAIAEHNTGDSEAAENAVAPASGVTHIWQPGKGLVKVGG